MRLAAIKRSSLLQRLTVALGDDTFWSEHLSAFTRGEHPERSLHVAVFREPFLSWVLEKKKPVESRFSQNQVAPYGQVREGDAIALKRVGGPVVGLCRARSVSSYRLEPRTWKVLREQFAELLCATDDAFWGTRKSAKFATLIFLDEVRALPDIEYAKSDRRGWVIDRPPVRQQSLDFDDL